MKKWKNGIIAVMITIILIFFTGSAQLSKPLISPSTVFSSSFIQSWYTLDWNEERWTEELLALKDAGVEELIIQTIADTKHKYATYPTDMSDYEYNGVDMIGNALRAADSVGIRIRLGLGFNDEWWVKNAMDRNWLMKEAEDNKNIFREIIAKYGEHKSIGGWYIPYEFYQFTAVTGNYQSNLNVFLKEIASEIKSKSDKDIMISPFYNSNYSWVMPLKSWSKMVENAMRDTGIDILALQDGIGVKNITIKQLDSLFSYTKISTDKLGVRLYGNVETFDSTPEGNVPASIDRIKSQLLIQKPYVEKFIAFSLNHFQSNQDKNQLNGFIKYLEKNLYCYFLKENN